MKYFKSILAMFLVLFFFQNAFTQIDTNTVNQHYKKAIAYYNENMPDSAFVSFTKTSELALSLSEPFKTWGIKKHFSCLNNIMSIYIDNWDLELALELADSVIIMAKKTLGDSTQIIANTYYRIGLIYNNVSQYNDALDNYQISLAIRLKLFGEKHIDVAAMYNSIGIVNNRKAEYEKALRYFYKSAEIFRQLLGEKCPNIASVYENIGITYADQDQYNQSLEYLTKSLEIRKELFGEKHAIVATSYNNIGSGYYMKNEFDKALEYYFKSLEIRQGLFDDMHTDIAVSYNNIGLVYSEKFEHKKALEYYFKSLEIFKNLIGEKSIEIADLYNNIGNTYHDMAEYDEAFRYYTKCLEISEELLGKDNFYAIKAYTNIGNIYQDNLDYDKALEFHLKSLRISRTLFGEKHSNNSKSYYNIGSVYYNSNNFDSALINFHLGIAACLIDFNELTNVNSIPVMNNYLEYTTLLMNLEGKAKTLTAIYEKDKKQNNFSDLEKLKLALKHYQLADTLITKTRKIIGKQSDKMALGESASQIYESAIVASEMLKKDSKIIVDKEKFDQISFYFSEQNKSMVLLEALSGQEGLKFADIPDSLLQEEHSLKTKINLYELKLSDENDSITEDLFRDKLFEANREYEELISNFESSYPEYYSLKYSTKNPSVKDLQKLLDSKTAIRSYFVGDSSIYIFTISNKKFDVQQVAKIDNLEDTIRYFRYGLTKFSQRMNDMYRRTGVLLYQQLFPETPVLNKQIENLIIIPDGALAIIPFEALLTDNSGSLNGDDFKKYPFLINRYNVSYSYSANLFYRTFPKDKQKQPELTNINDWLALAPVFDDKSEQGVMLATRELQKQLNNLQSDTLNVRGRLLTGDYITPLPGTESETQAIIKQYENRNLKAQALLHKSANEQFIKSGGLEKYKVLHFATHGFVNSEKPELSGILLAQDSTGNQDGILYSGEIYNLKLNADLVVLSACETGLGKINKGEGIIGLTRALLYAGSKNIIVSLWQVSDESTSDLMIDFYNNLLNTKNKSFSDPLRKAKLKMISEGKFAHPFYWSPFILVGK